jgi:hypothetical protein
MALGVTEQFTAPVFKICAVQEKYMEAVATPITNSSTQNYDLQTMERKSK